LDFVAPISGSCDNINEAGMTVKLELTPDVQESLRAQARAKGLSLEAFAEAVLSELSRTMERPHLKRSQLAGQRIREIRKGTSLAGVPIRELIEEGRE
jgi:hypothetical protein